MNEQYEIGIISGLISSLIATGIVAFFILIVRKIIIPKVTAFVYRGINLEGDWFDKGEKTDLLWDSTISIVQNGSNLKGEIIKKNTFKVDDKLTVQNLKFKGFVKDNKIVLNYDSKSAKYTNMGTILLRITDNGQNLKGAVLFISDKYGGTGMTELNFTRK